jgi:hypothetical protein
MFEAPPAIVTLPVNVPAVDSFVTSTDTDTDPGVVLLRLVPPAVAESQRPVLDAVAVNLAPAGELETAMLCAAGVFALPCV